jgi:hypothetical protein
MKTSSNYIPNCGNIALAVCFLFGALGNAQAQQRTPDENKIWTTVGSTGTVDKTDAGKVTFGHSVVQIGITLAGNMPLAQNFAQNPSVLTTHTESAVVRYNVTPVDGLFNPPPVSFPSTLGIQLKLRYLAVSAQVVAKLIEVDFATGVETTRMTFNSTAFPAVDGYHVQQVGECQPPFGFDFKLKAYYIEATLTHNPLFVGSAAGIQIIKIDNNFCLG